MILYLYYNENDFNTALYNNDFTSDVQINYLLMKKLKNEHIIRDN